MIPEEKKDAVAHALQQTFGVSEFEDICLLTEGLSSALIYRIVVLGKPYLLRVITRTDPISDPALWYNSMKMGAAAGLAPRVWYMGTDDRICITDFVEKKAFPITEARVKMPLLLKQLHSLPPFAKRVNYFDAVDGFIRRFQAAKILPESMTDELFRQYEQVRSVYPRDGSEFVSCHNDLKPENILFDGDRPWLVDWEAAFMNDRYMDLAMIANFVVTNHDEEKDYLKGYFGEELNEYHHARLFLMRQVLHTAYFTFLMNMVVAAGNAIHIDSDKPGFREFNEGIWTGAINLKGDKERQLYAWVHMKQLADNFKLKRFEESLAIVAG